MANACVLSTSGLDSCPPVEPICSLTKLRTARDGLRTEE